MYITLNIVSDEEELASKFVNYG